MMCAIELTVGGMSENEASYFKRVNNLIIFTQPFSLLGITTGRGIRWDLSCFISI